jgi:hypothetical protein
MQRRPVILGVNRESADSQFCGCTHYPNRDFTAIGDQQIRRHHEGRLRSRGSGFDDLTITLCYTKRQFAVNFRSPKS